jgi:hypothetical protein
MLMVALMAVAVMTIQGSIALSTSLNNITVSVKNRALTDGGVLAEAGIEEARRRMKGLGGADFLGDPMIPYGFFGIFRIQNPVWASYLISVPSWALSMDPEYVSGYTSGYTNYVPTVGALPVNVTTISLNSKQTSLRYWVKMRHKREYDAELEGHSVATTHYTDSDGSAATHTVGSPGSIVYYGYINNSAAPVEFTAPVTYLPLLSVPFISLASFFPVEVVKGYGTSGTTTKANQAYLVHDVGPQVAGALYSRGNVVINESSAIMNGVDSCGVAGSKPPLYYKDPATITGAGTYSGTPATPQHGTADVDIPGTIAKLKAGSPTVYDITNNNYDDDNTLFGSSQTNYVTAYYSNHDTTLKLKNVTGYGLLLVDGDLKMDDDATWYGLVYVTGLLESKAGNDTDDRALIRGAALAGMVSIPTNKRLDVEYDVCHIAKSMAKQPLKIRRWKVAS